MNKISILIIICFLIFACKNSESKEQTFPGRIASINKSNLITKLNHKPTQITIDLSKTIDGNFDDYFSLKNVIYLDNKSPIGQVTLIRQYKDRLFILDRENTQQLFCFDLKGKLIWEFKSKGGGPLEYNKISDFVINEKKQTIDVLDKNSYKIINLDIYTGIAKTEFKLGVYGREMVLYDNGDYLLHTENLTVSDELNYKLLLINTNQQINSRNLPVFGNDKNKHSTGFRSLEKSNGTIYFTETLNDTIYTIKNDTLRTRYYVDFLDKKYPEELNKNFTLDKAERLNGNKPYITPIDLVREKNGILNFMFSYKSSFYTVFYDISNKSTYIFNKLKNGKTFGEFEQILTQGYINDGFIVIIEPFMLEMMKESMGNNEKLKENLIKYKPELYNAIVKTNKNSNPILFVYEFKKNN